MFNRIVEQDSARGENIRTGDAAAAAAVMGISTVWSLRGASLLPLFPSRPSISLNFPFLPWHIQKETEEVFILQILFNSLFSSISCNRAGRPML